MFRPRFAHRGAVLAGALSALPNHVYRTLRVHVESDEQTQLLTTRFAPEVACSQISSQKIPRQFAA
jgi:hypothetical protein